MSSSSCLGVRRSPASSALPPAWQPGGDNSAGWGVVGALVGSRVNAASKGSYPSLVLALSRTRLYVLGREHAGLVRGFKNLHPVAHVERENLEVTQHRRGTVRVIGLTDTTNGTTLEVEAQTVGGLGLKDLLGNVEPHGEPAEEADGAST